MFRQIRERGLRLRRQALRLCRDRRGVTALEYGVIAALILVVCVASIGGLGNNVYSALFSRVAVAAGTTR